MNVALFASAFHPSLGGVEELVRKLAHEQEIQGDRPVIITNRWPITLPETEDFEGLALRRFRFRVPGDTWKHLAGTLLYGRSTLNAVCEEMRRQQIDLIHVQCVSSQAYYAVRAKRRLKLPLVVSLQGEFSMDASGLYQRSETARNLYRDALEQADAITACSGQTLAEAEEFFGRPFGARGQVVYNGVSLADFESAEPYIHSRPYILAIGRMARQKGFDLLIEAFARCGVQTQDLLIAGDGPEREALTSLVERLGQAGRIHFLGRADRPRVASLFRGCSFFVLPSRHEPMGIVNLEAMAAGRPVLAARVGGVPEFVIDNETGLLFPGGDAEALSKGICRLAESEDLRERLGAAGLEHARRFDWKEIASQYRKIYTCLTSITVASPVIGTTTY